MGEEEGAVEADPVQIQRLRGLSRPQFRLRVDDTRVCYDVTDRSVEVLAIVSKAQAEEWLREHSQPDPGSAAREDEG